MLMHSIGRDLMLTAPSSANDIWAALPSLLWFGLALTLVVFLRKELRLIFSEFAWRLRCGAALKISSVELGSIEVRPGVEVSQHEKEIGVHPDANRVRERERTGYREKTRDVMLVHRLYKSREDGQLYDLVIYVVPHKEASLAGVSQVEYFLGWYWGNKIFPSVDRSRGFPIATAAYGPMLCTAKVFFNDDTTVTLHRYIDFEMGSSAPAHMAGQAPARSSGRSKNPSVSEISYHSNMEATMEGGPSEESR